MTPTAQDLLNACIMTLATPPRPEDAGMFAAARLRLVALTTKLAAMESADAAAIRVRENTTLRIILAEAGPVHGIAADKLPDDGDYSIAVLDAANAALRRLLICLHEAAEQAGDRALDRRILKLYRDMAGWRELHLPPVKPAS
ncbi:MAG: hypothetical protein DI543_00355 [Bradyrhizobium icense]|jgi:hypothetical protein|nr:MAG: hypothetical protein DI543_00355 [Bradyrhizobium icense]